MVLIWVSLTGCLSAFQTSKELFLFLGAQTPNEPKDKQVVSAVSAQQQGCIWASFASAVGVHYPALEPKQLLFLLVQRSWACLCTRPVCRKAVLLQTCSLDENQFAKMFPKHHFWKILIGKLGWFDQSFPRKVFKDKHKVTFWWQLPASPV